MHVEKNVFENTIGILLDIPGKSKDGLSTRRELQTLGIRYEIPQERVNGKFFLPAASYNLILQEKQSICRCLHRIKVPTGFSTNIKNLVSMADLKMSGYNTHDCHVMLGLFLPIAVRGIKHPFVKMVITSSMSYQRR